MYYTYNTDQGVRKKRSPINLLSVKPFFEKLVFRLRKFHLCNAISGDQLNVNTK